MMYRVIVGDPPWEYGDKLRMSGTRRSATDQYNTMRTTEICHMAVHEGGNSQIVGHSIADNATLFLWVTVPFLLNGDGAKVCRAWGFEPKAMISWVKGRLKIVRDGNDPSLVTPELVLHTGMGRYTRGCTEHVIIATRGRCASEVKDHGVSNVILAPEETVFIAKRGKHSAKPEDLHEKVERLFDGPYLELFARERRPGWIAWGNELPGDTGTDLWDNVEPVSPEDVASAIYSEERGEEDGDV